MIVPFADFADGVGRLPAVFGRSSGLTRAPRMAGLTLQGKAPVRQTRHVQVGNLPLGHFLGVAWPK